MEIIHDPKAGDKIDVLGSKNTDGCLTSTLFVLDAVTGKRKRTLKGHTEEVWGLAFTRDGVA